MEFTVSRKEVMRRKAAYVVLVISMSVGSLLFSKLLDTPLLSSLYIPFFIVFSLLGVMSFRYLNLLMRMRIRFSDREIERLIGNKSERYLLSEIETIKIKRRSNGDIREISILFRNRKKLYINAFEQDFDSLARILVDKVDRNIPICTVHEPINFDHLLFYPVLGLVVSFYFVLLLKGMIQTDYDALKYYGFAISALTCLIAMSFACWKPIARRSGKRNTGINYIISAVLLILGIYIFSISANLNR
ncbi:MAG TPA: hypothetical protein PLI88_07505 [Bacillota bacterium]|nr:hypothetical protein [Bacillota bacterium]HOH10603.1 hypothetical protein [Bacillota bacterium]HOY89294.1 hypothetical protein [Bacillota bacterium]HPI01971.1 hypothetical protein [Bacillota bacterium]HPM63652.1 hypothetical protein [Bacillota bacterium]